MTTNQHIAAPIVRTVDCSGPAWVMRFECNGIELGHMYMCGPHPYMYEVYPSNRIGAHRVITEDEAEQWLRVTVIDAQKGTP